MKAIICSLQDAAGMNMFQRFLECGFKETGKQWQGMPVLNNGELELVRIKEDIIHASDLDALGAEEIIFASRHKSEMGISTLTAHATGVFGEADSAKYGGRSHELSFTNANTLRAIYIEMLKNPFKSYNVSLEVTHHGPTQFKTPFCFIELGSSEKQWGETEPAAFLVECILAGLKHVDKAEPAIGIGGNHYASVFSKLEAESLAFGHICPKYAQEALTTEIAKQMVQKTLPNPKRAIIDKKGTNKKGEVVKMLEQNGIEVELA